MTALLIETNRRLFGTIPANKYATLVYGIYSDAQRTLVYVNAGHNPPYLLRADGAVEIACCSTPTASPRH